MPTRYIGDMEVVARPLPSATWDALPAEAQALILALQAQVVALQTEVAALDAQRRELQARLVPRHLLFDGRDG